MAQWKGVDQQADAPIFSLDAQVSGTRANSAFGNTTVNVPTGISGRTVGIFGVSAAETANTLADGIAHAGWVKRTAFQGPVSSVTVVAGGTSGYTNGAVTFGAGVGNANAAATQTTNGSGQIVSIAVTAGGVYTTTPSITANGPGSGGQLTVVMGGRANRVQFETLVAMGSISGDASDDTLLPDA